MADLKEQRIYIKAFVKLAKFASDTREMITTAFGGNAVGRTQGF
jgi:hypothetical protein